MPNFPSDPYPNQVVSWQGYEYQWNGEQWVNLAFPNPAIVPVYASAAEPQPPIIPGSLWFNTLTLELSIWVKQGSVYGWEVTQAGQTEQPFVYVSVSSPTDPINGTLWYQPAQQILRIWVVTGLSGNWVVLIANASPEAESSTVLVSTSPPEDPTQGLLWFNPINNLLKIWVVTLSGSAWRTISGGSSPVKPTVLVSTSPPPNPAQGDLWFNPLSKILKVWNIVLGSGTWVETYPCDLLAAAASAAESAEQAANSAEIAGYYAEQAEKPWGLILIDSSQAGIIFVGKAPFGSPESAPVWKITKSTFSPSGILLTEQIATNVAWTNRYTAPYS